MPRSVEDLLIPSTLTDLVPGVLQNASKAEVDKWIAQCGDYRDKTYIPRPSQSHQDPVVHAPDDEDDSHDHDNDNTHQHDPQPGEYRQNLINYGPEDPDPAADESETDFSYFFPEENTTSPT